MNLTEISRQAARAQQAGDTATLEGLKSKVARYHQQQRESAQPWQPPEWGRCRRTDYERLLTHNQTLQQEIKRLRSELGRKGERCRLLEADNAALVRQVQQLQGEDD
jgi:hypothetical protein